MKTILIFMSFAILLISCESKTETVVAPTYYPEGWGENINVPASFGFQDALDFINTTDSLSKLKNIHGTNVNYLGSGSNWEYQFVSGDLEKIYLVSYEFGNDLITIGVDTLDNDQDGGSIITKSWIDSDLALEIAEKNSGSKFRTENTDYQISVSLSEYVVPNSFPIWSVNYSSADNLSYRICKASDGNGIS